VENTCGEVSAHKTSLSPPLLIEVPVKQDQKVYFYSCVLDIDFLSFSSFVGIQDDKFKIKIQPSQIYKYPLLPWTSSVT
jgi:hypothetical protein